MLNAPFEGRTRLIALDTTGWNRIAAWHDAIILTAALGIGVLLALQFDLFSSGGFVTDPPEKKITVVEALALGVLLSVGLFIFALRRLREQRHEHALRVAAEDKLGTAEFLADHDELTGLPNRRMCADRLTAALTPGGGLGAVLLLDLDRFKEINDGFGHPTGDKVLRVVGQRLRAALPADDFVARMGGDEFAVLLFGAQSDTSITQISARLIDAVEGPIVVEGRVHRVGASIGVARAPSDGDTADALVACADADLYRAKGRPIAAVKDTG
jgi:diguanylate cyclase (GGDEF)-like protein